MMKGKDGKGPGGAFQRQKGDPRKEGPIFKCFKTSFVIKNAPNTLVLNVLSNCSLVISVNVLHTCCSAELLTNILILLNLLITELTADIQKFSSPISPLIKIHSCMH